MGIIIGIIPTMSIIGIILFLALLVAGLVLRLGADGT